MAISFNEIPNAPRVPFVFVEFDTSKAQQGPSIQVHKALLIGQRLSTGTKPAGQVDLVTSESQAKQFYGAGSMLAAMVKKYLENNKVTSLSCISLDDDGGAVAATGNLLFAGASIEAGTLSLMVAGIRYQVAVAAGDTPADVATAVAAAITAEVDSQVSAVVDGVTAEKVNLTHKNKGAAGNELDVRYNPFSDDQLPVNLTVTVTGFSGGSGNPDITDAITAMADTQYNEIGCAYTDSANLILLEAEMADRFGPIRQIDGVVFTAKKETYANLITFGDGRNSPHVSCMGFESAPNAPWEWAAAICGVVAKYGPIDPARPFQTLVVSDLWAPSEAERFTFTERDLLLKDGISTFSVDAGGLVRCERLITMYQENAFGAPDTSLLDVNTLLTLSYLRYDFRTRMQNKYPRHKLANDGTRVGPGQAVLTPKIAKAEAIAIFRGWEELGLVENIDQFKRDLIVERNVSDPNRLDFMLPPDLINQLRVIGAQVAFLL